VAAPKTLSDSVRHGLRTWRLGNAVGGHDEQKASKRRQHARLAYVIRVGNRASVSYAVTSFRPMPRFKKTFDAAGLRIARIGLRYELFARHAGSRDVRTLTICLARGLT
jgi:hypothetical protein